MTVLYEHNFEQVILMPKLSGHEVKKVKNEVVRLNQMFNFVIIFN